VSRRAEIGLAVGAALLAAALWWALHLLPAQHRVDIGGADAAYVQGLGEREQVDAPAAQPYLAGANNARHLTADSALLFPQSGAPGSLSIRWRTTGTAPMSATILLNGAAALQTVVAYPEWSVTRVPVAGTQTKLSGDWFVTFGFADPESIYLDQVIYNVGPGQVVPAPLPWAAAALGAALLLGLLPRRWRPWQRCGLAAGAVVLGLALLYRWQPPLIPYPLRRGPFLLVGALLAAHLLRWAPLAERRPRLAEGLLIGGGLLAWAAWLWTLQRQHLVLSLPGVEADFSVFAKRSAAWGEIWRADGFYQLGYPLLLGLVRPLFHDNPFLAAQAINVVCALIVAASTWALARTRWGRLIGAAALLLVTLNPLLVQSTLAVGTDMPFAALCSLALLLALAPRRPNTRTLLVAGASAGLAFSIRHPGLLLLPWAMAVAYLTDRGRTADGDQPRGWRRSRAPLLILAGFLAAAGPQIAVNLRDTGQPLYSQQAKNIWLAVYGNTEFRRWDEESNAITLFEVVRRDPARFGQNWGGNIAAFLGSGGAREAEFERAVQLRLLAWPFNLLALGGLAAWLLGWRRQPAGMALLAWAGLYVLGVSIGFLLPRFALPLIPVYALAASHALILLGARLRPGQLGEQRWRTAAATLLLIALIGAPQAASGAGQLLGRQVPAELAIARAVQANVPAGAPIAAQVEPRTAIAKYSAVAHRLTSGADPATARWLVSEGPAPAGWRVVAQSGRLGLYVR
jgi:4-amino-4-deoxy-L-arabinose transferase-like glycosyltransferase